MSDDPMCTLSLSAILKTISSVFSLSVSGIPDIRMLFRRVYCSRASFSLSTLATLVDSDSASARSLTFCLYSEGEI